MIFGITKTAVPLLSSWPMSWTDFQRTTNKPQRLVKYCGIEPLSTILSWLEQYQNQLHTSCNDTDVSMSSRLASEKQDSTIPRLSTGLPVEWWANQLSVNIADKATGEAIWLQAITLRHITKFQSATGLLHIIGTIVVPTAYFSRYKPSGLYYASW